MALWRRRAALRATLEDAADDETAPEGVRAAAAEGLAALVDPETGEFSRAAGKRERLDDIELRFR